MRQIVFIMLLFISCKGATGPTGPDGLRGFTGDQGAPGVVRSVEAQGVSDGSVYPAASAVLTLSPALGSNSNKPPPIAAYVGNSGVWLLVSDGEGTTEGQFVILELGVVGVNTLWRVLFFNVAAGNDVRVIAYY